jgi:hypothetical protein
MIEINTTHTFSTTPGQEYIFVFVAVSGTPTVQLKWCSGSREGLFELPDGRFTETEALAVDADGGWRVATPDQIKVIVTNGTIAAKLTPAVS